MAKRQLTQRQKDWVKERDGYRCVFHTWMNGNGLVRCPNIDNLHVHHIKAHSYLAQFYPVIVELPTNLVLVCVTHHDIIHPDMVGAKRDYHRDKNSFEKVFSARKRLLDKGIKHWNDHWDTFFKYWAMEATLHFVKKKEWPA